MRQGSSQVLGHLFPIGLVFRVDFVAWGWSPGIEGDGQMGGLLLLQDGQDGIGKPVQCGAVYPIRGKNRVTDQGKMCPVGQCHTIEQEEPLHPGGSRGKVLRSTVSPNLTNR